MAGEVMPVVIEWFDKAETTCLPTMDDGRSRRLALLFCEGLSSIVLSQCHQHLQARYRNACPKNVQKRKEAQDLLANLPAQLALPAAARYFQFNRAGEGTIPCTVPEPTI